MARHRQNVRRYLTEPRISWVEFIGVSFIAGLVRAWLWS